MPADLQVSAHAELHIALPFLLYCDAAVLQPDKRKAILEGAAQKLNNLQISHNKAKDFSDWSATKTSPRIPDGVLRRKGCVLKSGKVVHSRDDLPDLLGRLVEIRHESTHAHVESVTERIQYFDHGMGIINIKVVIVANTPGSLTKLGTFASDLRKHFQNQSTLRSKQLLCVQSLPLMADQLREIFKEQDQSFTASHELFAVLGESSTHNHLLETHCTSLQLQIVESPGTGTDRTVFNEDIQLIADSICGGTASLERFHGHNLLIAHGYTGQLLAWGGETSNSRGRIIWMWRLAAIYWSLLFHLVDCLAAVLRTLESDSPQNYERALKQFHAIRAFATLIEYESDPVVLCDDAFDRQVYGSLWKQWHGQDLVHSMDRMIERCVQCASDIATADERKRTNMIQHLLAFIAIISTAGTLAEGWPKIIGSLEYSENWQTNMYYLGSVIFIMTILATIYIGMLLYAKRRHKKKRV